MEKENERSLLRRREEEEEGEGTRLLRARARGQIASGNGVYVRTNPSLVEKGIVNDLQRARGWEMAQSLKREEQDANLV